MGSIATIHAFLRTFYPDIENPEDGVQFGPSTSNKVNANDYDWIRINGLAGHRNCMMACHA